MTQGKRDVELVGWRYGLELRYVPVGTAIKRLRSQLHNDNIHKAFS